MRKDAQHHYQRNANQNTMSYHLTQVRTAIIKNSTNNKCGKKGTLLHCWWECKLVQPLWKTVERFLRKLKIDLSYELAIPLLGIYPNKILIRKDACTPMFIAALFTIAKARKPPKCPPTDDWIKKVRHVYTLQYYPAMKKNKICHLQQHGGN